MGLCTTFTRLIALTSLVVLSCVRTERIEAKSGEEVVLSVTTKQKFLSCHFVGPNRKDEDSSFFMISGVKYENDRIVNSHFGSNQDGEYQCTLKITSVQEKDNGRWIVNLLSDAAATGGVQRKIHKSFIVTVAGA